MTSRHFPETAIVFLECGHRRVITMPWEGIFVGAVTFCNRCREPREITAMPEEYKVKCDCGFSRKVGTARYHALVMADRHSRKYPGHHTSVWLGQERLPESPAPIQLALDDIEPPF